MNSLAEVLSSLQKKLATTEKKRRALKKQTIHRTQLHSLHSLVVTSTCPNFDSVVISNHWHMSLWGRNCIQDFKRFLPIEFTTAPNFRCETRSNSSKKKKYKCHRLWICRPRKKKVGWGNGKFRFERKERNRMSHYQYITGTQQFLSELQPPIMLFHCHSISVWFFFVHTTDTV